MITLQSSFPEVYKRLLTNSYITGHVIGLLNSDLMRNRGSILSTKRSVAINVARFMYGSPIAEAKTNSELKTELEFLPLFELAAMNHYYINGLVEVPEYAAPNDTDFENIRDLLKDMERFFGYNGNDTARGLVEVLLGDYPEHGLN